MGGEMVRFILSSTNKHQQAPTSTNKHQQAPASTNKHQQAPTSTNKHQQAPTSGPSLSTAVADHQLDWAALAAWQTLVLTAWII